LLPYTTLFRSDEVDAAFDQVRCRGETDGPAADGRDGKPVEACAPAHGEFEFGDGHGRLPGYRRSSMKGVFAFHRRMSMYELCWAHVHDRVAARAGSRRLLRAPHSQHDPCLSSG